jgi:hypothetical protein
MDNTPLDKDDIPDEVLLREVERIEAEMVCTSLYHRL